jgi:hypothetical protein
MLVWDPRELILLNRLWCVSGLDLGSGVGLGWKNGVEDRVGTLGVDEV